MPMSLDRRGFHQTVLAAAAASTAMGNAMLAKPAVAGQRWPWIEPEDFQFRFLLASCLYGYAPLAEILPEAAKVGASAIDLWPKVHGNQREQLDEMGQEAFAELLQEHRLQLGCLTQYKLGPLALQDEMRLAQVLGCQLIVTGGIGPRGLSGPDLKRAVADFVEQMKPHLEVAAETGVTIAIENHSNNLICTPDSLKYLLELRPNHHLAIALAPYHLAQNPQEMADLIRHLDQGLALFYAWEHGLGSQEKLPKEQELQQLPGRGPLDFAPLIQALADINFRGWTEIFMHPVPRGIPIHDSTAAVTDEINRARDYLEQLRLKLADSS